MMIIQYQNYLIYINVICYIQRDLIVYKFSILNKYLPNIQIKIYFPTFVYIYILWILDNQMYF